MDAEKGYKPPPDFDKDPNEPLVDLDLTDNTELWLIQWPLTHELDFDGQEVTLKLDQDGSLGSFTGTSGKEYEVVSYKSQDADTTVFVSSASEAKIAGKISRRVSIVHYPEPIELEKHDPNKAREDRDTRRYERTIAPSRGFSPSNSRSTYVTNPHGRGSNHSNSSSRSHHRPKGSVFQAESTPAKSARKRPPPPSGSKDRSSQDYKRNHSGTTTTTSSEKSKLLKIKQELVQ